MLQAGVEMGEVMESAKTAVMISRTPKEIRWRSRKRLIPSLPGSKVESSK